MLENHVADWVELWGFGMAFHGEQGGESIHHDLHEITTHMHGIRGEVSQLMSVMKEHHVKINPVLTEYVPQPKRRKPLE